MQRLIKFRGISVDTNEFVYGYYVERKEPHDESHKIYDPNNGTWHSVKPETVGQFTGLKDNTKWEELAEKERGEWVKVEGNFPGKWNGKEIYEGDLLNPTKGFTGDIYQVIFDLAGFRWLLIYDEHLGRNVSKERRTAPLHFGVNYKIIGNALENPELLK